MRTIVLALLVPAVATAQPNTAKTGDAPATDTGPTQIAPAKSTGACNSKILPLSVGNEWTYTMVPAPKPAEPAIARVSPPPAAQIVITVKSVDAKPKEDTVVTLEEKYSYDVNKDTKKPPNLVDTVVTSTITCGAKKFEISPNSFFFAAEPGAAFGLEFDQIERKKDTSIKLTNGTIGDQPWREDIVAHWTRKATPNSGADLGSGKLELERQFTPQQPEPVATKAGTFKCEKLGLVTTGRVTLDHLASPGRKPYELPAGWFNQIWMSENVGVVQTLNGFAHMYQLADAKLK